MRNDKVHHAQQALPGESKSTRSSQRFQGSTSHMGPDLHGTDVQLVEATLAGDAKAYRELVERHEHRVYRFLLKHVACADEAEDLAQETFLQAYRSLRSYQASAQFTTWLIGIGLNVARNHHNRSRLPAAGGDEEIEKLLCPAADPADSARQTALLRALHRAMSGLPADQRECVTMIALEGLAYDEASLVLGVPIGTIKSRLSRARAKLAELLKDH
jgi:RNA polymerase sigma-70 factor (ECF subfamily)